MDLSREFLREENFTKKYLKKSSPLAITVMQIKTTWKFHLMPIRMDKIKKRTDNKYW